jgi:hypothetical protein
MIAAYSPEARGRSERMFGTLQNRLPQELQLAGIKDMGSANHFLKEKFMPQFNARFKVKPAEPESAFVPWSNANRNLEDILCIQEQRTVNKDNTVSYRKKSLQIPQNVTRFSYAKTQVKIHEYADRTLSIFHGPRCLERFDPNGNSLPQGSW